MIQKVKAYFGRLKGNSAVCIAAHPFWAIPYMFYTYYISLYLVEKGISDTQLGTLMVAGTAAATLFSFLSAPVVDFLGRRRATLIFDLLSSALPPLIYFFTQSFLTALIAQVFFNANRIMSVSYYLVMIEDAEDEERLVAFNLFNAISVVAGLLLPIGGLIVARLGLIKAERIFLLASFLIMTLMILIRHRLLKETKVGEHARERIRQEKLSPGTLIRGLWQPYKDAFSFLLKAPAARAFTLANIFFCVYMNLGTNYSLYFVPYFTDRLGMDTMQSSVLGSVYYGGMLAAMIFINPRFGSRNLIKGILVSGGATLLGFVLMIGIPGGIFWLAIIATLVMAVGYGSLKSSVEGAFSIYTEGEYRSGIYSLANLFSSGLGILVTALCSLLYGRFAGWLYILCGIMVLLSLLAVAGARKKQYNKPEAEASSNTVP